MDYEQLKDNEDMYQERMDELTPDGTHLGSVLFPSADASPMACEVFHELMTEHGFNGIEYIQEGLHQNSDYIATHFDTKEEVIADFERFEEIA